MAKLVVDDASLVAVADAIRAKGGISDELIFPEGFISAVGAIRGGIGEAEINQILNEFGSGKLEHQVLNYTEDSFRGYSAFVNANFEEVNITQAKIITEYCFENCLNLEKVVLNSVERIKSLAFIGCEKLSTVVITTPSVPLLDDINAFDVTPIISYEGSIYVPQDMVEEYLNDTNWATFDIQAIENLEEDE